MNEIKVDIGNKNFALREESTGDSVVWRAFDLATNQAVEGAEFVVSSETLSDRSHTDQFEDPSEAAVNELKQRLEEKFGERE